MCFVDGKCVLLIHWLAEMSIKALKCEILSVKIVLDTRVSWQVFFASQKRRVLTVMFLNDFLITTDFRLLSCFVSFDAIQWQRRVCKL